MEETDSGKVDQPLLASDEDKIKALNAYISKHQTYTPTIFGFENLTDEQATALQQVLQEARDHNYLFRAEARHPYAEGKYDQEEGFTAGPFEEGFRLDGTHYDERIYATADPSVATLYPDWQDVPLDWDGSSYIYIIDPRSIYQNPRDIKVSDFRMNEIGISHDIPPQDIKYAIARRVDKRTFFNGRSMASMVTVLKNAPTP